MARAKTVPEAVYMQVMRDDFKVNAQFSKEAILSCVVHEMMHYWSYLGTGIQDYNRRASVDWDEAVADVLGFRVYKRTYSGQASFAHYITPYNTYCKCCEKAKNGFKSVSGRLARRRQSSPSAQGGGRFHDDE